jgi:hypothetical protein
MWGLGVNNMYICNSFIVEDGGIVRKFRRIGRMVVVCKVDIIDYLVSG